MIKLMNVEKHILDLNKLCLIKKLNILYIK